MISQIAQHTQQNLLEVEMQTVREASYLDGDFACGIEAQPRFPR